MRYPITTTALVSAASLAIVSFGIYQTKLADKKWERFMIVRKCSKVIELPGEVDIPLSATSHITRGVTFSSPKEGFACDDGHLYWANKRS